MRNASSWGIHRTIIIAARKAGGIPVAILTGEDPLDLPESEKPEFIFRNLTELTLFLEEQERKGRDPERKS